MTEATSIWSYWGNVATVRLEAAVLLSCGIDPRGKDETEIRQLPFANARYQIARSHIQDGTLPTYATVEDRHYVRGFSTGVKLAEFRAWGESLPSPFTFPDEFPKAAKPEPAASAAPAGRWPWGEHETQLLRKLSAAADRFWKLYDPEDASTAPTNDAVVAWLKEQGVAERNAQVMATILRADGLPTGPRK
ncbi:hypothetical protein J2X06_001586 [Lysobacter niastensis]|uniref:Uncharacterized protein n=1 Tax=Lysobacter niastensis TaxID=380629 RepID=A0ABU1WAE8_9GAMM|nr:hypothetical protein [Lysobacter niastensis]MDR7134402.1 hypothetical protein [Lysobacter niastensis]